MGKSRFDELLSTVLLNKDRAGAETTKALKCAVALLLWEMAQADGVVSPAEIEAMLRTLDHEFQQMSAESGSHLSVAEVMSHRGAELDRALYQLDARFDQAQRERLYAHLLRVAKADGVMNRYEEIFARFLRSRLLLPD